MNGVIGINDAESSGSHTHPPTYLSHLDVFATASTNNETMQNKETSNIFFHQLLYNAEYFNSNIVNYRTHNDRMDNVHEDFLIHTFCKSYTKTDMLEWGRWGNVAEAGGMDRIDFDHLLLRIQTY